MVLFGSAKDPSFSAEWRRQSFFFCDLPGLEYWLIQHKVCMWTCSVPVGVYKLPFYTCTVLWGWGTGVLVDTTQGMYVDMLSTCRCLQTSFLHMYCIMGVGDWSIG